MTKLNKPSKFFMVNMELMLHDLLVDIMERYDYSIEQAQELINAVVEAQAEEIQEEQVVSDNIAEARSYEEEYKTAVAVIKTLKKCLEELNLENNA